MNTAIKIEVVPISSLVHDPTNARKHSKKNIEAIKGSLAKFGQRQPILVAKGNVVVVGNGRLTAAIELGWETIQISRVEDLSPTEITALALADNRTGELADWEAKNLSEILKSLRDEKFDLKSIGFDDKDLANMIATIVEPGAGNTDPDHIPDIMETRCKNGDVWELGNHRLVCGDSTNLQDVETLMDGQKADMVWTDPPYNVAYVGKTADALTIKNDKMEDSGFRQFLLDNFRGAARDAGWLVKQCLVWVKSSIVMGRQDYQWKHEPILYGWLDGAPHLWYADRKQSTVLEFDRPNRNDIHPTMKPVELVSYCVNNSSKHGDLVLDLFGGSGTTLMACEQLGRSARIMELDPKYCDAILTRWEAFTGRKATRIDG